ncbi:MAG TPA: hypothetical protein VNJ51_13135 [Candidatus Dormibacteraeota bacterium]|nr:hypothetical protein [Candidatus Dormibacteraeota bacterium]
MQMLPEERVMEYQSLEAQANREYERDVRDELRETGTLVREQGLSRGV